MPQFVGEPGSLLGSSLAACPGNGFVAGAPGEGTAWLSGAQTMPQPIGDGLGRTVACERLGGVALMLAGGDAGVRKESAGVWFNALTPAPTLSLSRSDEPTLPLLVGGEGTVNFFNPSSGAKIGMAPVNTAGFGSVVLWMKERPRFLVSYESGLLVQQYAYNPLTKTAAVAGAFTNATAGFGKALAVGDLLPTPGDEVAIGADGKVYIYSATGAALLILPGTETSFGSALAVQREYGAGIDALLVGEPTLDRVHRFVGDAGTVISSISTPGSMFGASLAVDPVKTLAIGAPLYQGGGAVFFESLGGLVRTGESKECVTGTSCRTNACTVGVCVGGAFCDTSTGTGASVCDPGERCVFGICVASGVDAGIDGGTMIDPPDSGVFPSVDAGMRDAGSEAGNDAGSSDAGSGKDAGSDDAGVNREPLLFSTSGCSTGGALPMLLLALVMFRRARLT